MSQMLPYDIQQKILQFKEPKEIIAFYDSLEDVIQEMFKHTNFILECKVVLSDKEIEWFESKKINLKLLEEYKIDEYGNQFWYKNGKFHRDNDLPAMIFSDGRQFWFKNGQMHRDNDLPATIYPNGQLQEWFQNGKFHRDNDLPAVIFSNGHQSWYNNGEIHRDNDLPAIILANGHQYWYKNDLIYCQMKPNSGIKIMM
jgi:antitoxin component YwqK of YwqJK toxin-antitoxin module